MRQDIDQAISNGILKPASELRLNPEADEEFKDGLILGQDASKLFCNVVNSNRVEKLLERSQYSDYLVVPTKFGFRKMVRIMAIVLSFVNKCRRRVPTSLVLTENPEFRFSIFLSVRDMLPEYHVVSKVQLFEYFATCSNESLKARFTCTQTKNSGVENIEITDDYVSQALIYLYKKATCEVLKFNSKEKVDKIGVIKDGILLSKGRILDGMNFVQAGGMAVTGLDDLGVKAYTPVIDRFSPLAYSIGNHIHWDIGKHHGIETCNRISLENVTILQGVNLYKELSENCVRCRMRRR